MKNDVATHMVEQWTSGATFKELGNDGSERLAHQSSLLLPSPTWQQADKEYGKILLLIGLLDQDHVIPMRVPMRAKIGMG